MANLKKTPKRVNMRQRISLCRFYWWRLIVGEEGVSGSARGSEDGNFNINDITSIISLAAKIRMFIKEREISIMSNSF